MTIEEEMIKIGEKARNAAFILKNSPSNSKNNALLRMADELEQQADKIVEANKKDLDNAKKNNLEQAKVDRLVLNPVKIHKIAEGLREVAGQPDPVGQGVVDPETKTGPGPIVRTLPQRQDGLEVQAGQDVAEADDAGEIRPGLQ